jgi:hypothetical protein
MKRKEVVAALGISVISTLSACGSNEETAQSDLLKMINEGDTIEIEIAVPENLVDADENTLAWIILASLTSQEGMRAQWDDTLKVTLTADGKNGCLYVDADGKNENNNTLRVVLHNRAFLTMLEDPDVMDALAQAADVAYTDIDSTENTEKAFYMALNAYFNVLPDSADGAANADDAISRKEFMSMVARSELQVDDSLTASAQFTEAVGKSEFNVFAEQEAKYSYLDLESKSLNNKTYNGVMSRGEAIYLIVNRFYADDLAKVGTMGAQFSDCKDGGNIAEQQKFIENGLGKDYYRDYEMVYALQNPDDGCPSAIYNAMVVARNKGLIGDETRWDEGITKYEAIKLIVEALKGETGIQTFNFDTGTSGEVEEVTENVADNTDVDRVNGGGEDTDLSEPENEDEAEYLAQQEDEEEGTKTEEEVVESDIEPASGTYYAKQACNLRSGPSTDYEKVGSLAYKQEIQVTGRSKSTGWYELEINGQKVYVSDKLITTEKPVDQKQSGGNSSTTKPSGGNSGQQSGGNGNGGGSSSSGDDVYCPPVDGMGPGDTSDLPIFDGGWC